MTLQHLKRQEVAPAGFRTWTLTEPEGQRISVFDQFCEAIREDKYATRRRYAIVVSRFIDYLYDVQILGAEPVTKRSVNEAIDYYIQLLKHGENISLGLGNGENKIYQTGDKEREVALQKVARRLGIVALAPGSWSNTIAPLNRFLRICQSLEEEARQIAIIRGGFDQSLVDASAVDYLPLLTAVAGSTSLTRCEAQHIRHSTMLGGVLRYRDNDIRRPRGIKSGPKHPSRKDLENTAFPMNHFPSLLQATTSWRDKALWTLLAAAGIRRSDALNLEWNHIDFENEEIYVLDPNLTRYSRDVSTDERHNRFKGRATSWTYLRLPYRTWLFEYLRQYRKNEYVLPADGNQFVFQYLIWPHQGRPMREEADSTLNSLFTDAVRRSGIPGPPMNPEYTWTCHSLRHSYGMYMLNDVEVPGQTFPGLTEAEVQMLLGHTSVLSTRKYARTKLDRLKQKLLAHDQKIISPEEIPECPLPENAIQAQENILITRSV